MQKRRRIYEVREKIIFEGAELGTYIQFFKDDSSYPGDTAENDFKEEPRPDGKGVLHNRISEYIFARLAEIGVPSYFIKSLNMREQLVHTVEMIPLRLVCRNAVAGSLARRLGLVGGTPLPRSVFEFFYKDEKLDYPLVSEEHILTFGWANEQDLEEMLTLTARINDFLCGLYAAIGLYLVDFKLEFGRLWEGDIMRIVLADEISPDSCRLWDRKLWESKFRTAPDRPGDKVENHNDKTESHNKAPLFRRAVHEQVAHRLGLLNKNRPVCTKGPVLVRS
ncbi:MAG: phosphoribosylaminoimidazolesuccinocarboxamide synthase [Candidatus Tokpelaia sp.]|nr:MAG: phosphoribosylaminoimidazolesuccinocarboxamide synthase [Candidatus Tokpelaia sp.]KAA6207825.1 MAG: phosphoribosylaminoimidazolesuccinocarboxamide synthase [Candidatus Tokpelaia sp.]